MDIYNKMTLKLR